MWAYIRRVDAFYPPEAATWGVQENRAAYDRMAAEFRAPRPERVQVSDHEIAGVPCRSYSVGAASVQVVYYHGGGFCLGGLDSHDDVCAELCDRTGFDVVSVDYALAPERPFPSCYNDAFAVFAALAASDTRPLLLCGDSAGGNLAAAVAHAARASQPGRVNGAVLIYPGLGADGTASSYTVHAEAPHLTLRDLQAYASIRMQGAATPEGDPRYAPLQDTDFAVLPPIVSITAECDPLASDGGDYRDRIRAAGGQAAWINVPCMVHGCLRARNMSAKAAGFFDEIVKAVSALGAGSFPYED